MVTTADKAAMIAPITKVVLHYAKGPLTGRNCGKPVLGEHYVPTVDVDLLVQASIRLHHTPGINPHTGGAAARIWKITSEDMVLSDPCWWTKPSLNSEDNTKGARSISWHGDTILFLDETSQEHIEAERARQEQLEIEQAC